MKTTKKAAFVIGIGLLFAPVVNAQHLKDAQKLTENHQFEEASKLFHKLIAEKPTDAHLYYYMGENMYKSERFDSAAWYYEKGITVDANVGLNYVGKGKIALMKNDEATAKPLFEKAVFHHNHDAKAYIAIAEAYVENEWKDMTYAVECLGHAEKLERNNIDVYLLLGDAALLSTNDGIAAITNYEKARDMEPKNPKPLIRIGTLYERARSYDLAFEEYNKALALDTMFAPTYLKMGDLWYQFGDYPKALENLDKYVKLSGSLSARIKRTKYRFLTKDYQLTIIEIQEIIQELPTSYPNVLNRLLGFSYYETKQYCEAQKAIELFFKNQPVSGDKLIADDYRYHGMSMYNCLKDSASAVNAIPLMLKAIEMDSTKLAAYKGLSDAYWKLKRYDEAVNILLKKFTMIKEPSDNDIFQIGQILYSKAGSLGDSATYWKADSVFAIITTNRPDLVSAHLFRARANAGMDPDTKTGLAKPHYDAVVALGTLDIEKNKKNLVEAHYYLAYYYLNMKDKVKGLENINKVIEYDPTNKDAPNLKKLLEKLPDQQ